MLLREVLLQDLPFIELECPTHSVLNVVVFRNHAATWQKWKAAMLDFHSGMSKVESNFFCPSLPIVGSNPGMQLQVVAKWIQQAIEDVLITHAFQVRVWFPNSSSYFRCFYIAHDSSMWFLYFHNLNIMYRLLRNFRACARS